MKHYSIAGFRLRATSGLPDSLPGFGEFSVEGAAAVDLEIVPGAVAAPGRGALQTFAAGETVHAFGALPEGWYFSVRRPGAFAVRMFYDRAMARATICGPGDAALVKMAFWIAFSLLATGRGAIPVHASAVVHEGGANGAGEGGEGGEGGANGANGANEGGANGGGAVLFLGESGTGKSTHTALWTRHIAGSRLLNDDGPVVRLTPAGVVASGSPWSGKTPCYRPESAPLKAIVRLSQGPRNRIERLSGVRALGALWPSCPPLLASDGALSAAMLETVGRVVAAVPVYRMECRPDPQAAAMAHSTIFESR